MLRLRGRFWREDLQRSRHNRRLQDREEAHDSGRIAVLDSGRLARARTSAEAARDSIVTEAYPGLGEAE